MCVSSYFYEFYLIKKTHIGGVMVNVLASSAVDRGFKPWSGQTKDYIKLVCVASTLSTQH